MLCSAAIGNAKRGAVRTRNSAVIHAIVKLPLVGNACGISRIVDSIRVLPCRSEISGVAAVYDLTGLATPQADSHAAVDRRVIVTIFHGRLKDEGA